MNSEQNKISVAEKTKKALVFSVFSFLLFFFLTPGASAWDSGGIPGAIYKSAQESITKTIDGTIMSALAYEAGIFIQEEVSKSIGLGVGMKGVVDDFVQDWEAFLIEEPGNQASAYLEEFLFNASGGRTSENYRSKVKKIAYNSEGFGEGYTVRYGLFKTASAAGATSTATVDLGRAEKLGGKIRDAAGKAVVNDQVGNTEIPKVLCDPNHMFHANNGTGRELSLKCLFAWANGANNYTNESIGKRAAQKKIEAKKTEMAIRAIVGRGIITDDPAEALAREAALVKADTWFLDQVLAAQASGNPVALAQASAFLKINRVLKKSIRNVRKSYQKDLDVYRSNMMKAFEINFEGARPEDVFQQQLADKEARQNKYGTGANYESIDATAEKKQNDRELQDLKKQQQALDKAAADKAAAEKAAGR